MKIHKQLRFPFCPDSIRHSVTMGMMLGIVTFALLNLGLALTQPTAIRGCQFPKVAHTVRVTAEYEEQALLSDHTYQVTQQANEDFYHTYSEFDTDNGGGAKLGWEDKLSISAGGRSVHNDVVDVQVRLYFCATFAWFLRQCLLLEICDISTP